MSHDISLLVSQHTRLVLECHCAAHLVCFQKWCTNYGAWSWFIWLGWLFFNTLERNGVNLVGDLELYNGDESRVDRICQRMHDDCFSQQYWRKMVQLICLNDELAVQKSKMSQMSHHTVTYILGLAAGYF